MPCRPIHLPGHGVAMACTRGFARRRPPVRCGVCHVPDTLATLKLCDGPGRRPGTTCDAPVCVEHAVHVEPDTDYCPVHAGMAPAAETSFP